MLGLPSNRSVLYPIIIFLLFIALSKSAFSQDGWWKDKRFKTEEKREKYYNCKSAFVNIGDGFFYANSYNISPYFSGEVYLEIPNADKGSYDQEQCRYIIDNFLTSNPVSSFKWKSSTVSDNYAFAIGKYKYKLNGYISTSTVSVSLQYINSQWLIDQIIIN